MSFNKNKSRVKILLIFLFIGVYSQAIASYDSQIKQIDDLIQMNVKTIKSTEKLDIPKYKGDTLTFERLSKIRNVFNADHVLPFEKRRVRESVAKQQKNVVELKPIKVPEELQMLMDRKKTTLQNYPLETFVFKGVVFQNGDEWGVVENSKEVKPMYVQKNQLIGEDYGKIESITKDGILVKLWKKDEKERVWKSLQVVVH